MSANLLERQKAKLEREIRLGKRPPLPTATVLDFPTVAPPVHIEITEQAPAETKVPLTGVTMGRRETLVDMRAQIRGLYLTLAELREEVEAEDTPLAALSSRTIALATARYYKVSQKELFGPDKLQYIARPRMVAMYLVKEITNRSFPAIGRCFKRHHSTIVHAWQKIRAARESDASLDRQIEEILSILNREHCNVG